MPGTLIEPVVDVRISHIEELPLCQEQAPYEIWAENVSPGVERTNVQLQIVDNIGLNDVRKLKSGTPALETHAFEYLYQKFPDHCGIRTADDIGTSSTEQVQRIFDYLDCMIELLRDTYNCSKVLCFDWRVRRAVGGHGFHFQPRLSCGERQLRPSVKSNHYLIDSKVTDGVSPPYIAALLPPSCVELEFSDLYRMAACHSFQHGARK